MSEEMQYRETDEVNTIEEAIRVLLVIGNCDRTTCSKCWLNNHCTDSKHAALDFIAETLAEDGEKELSKTILPSLKIKVATEEVPEPEMPKRVSGYWFGGEMLARCETCEHKTDLKGGYMFCEKFHNTTIPDGYCHNYEEYEDKGNEEENEG